jgi:DUF4097 and DUF4098 domain-containing protein YvlB
VKKTTTLVFFCLFATPATAGEDVHRNVKADPDGEVRIVNVAGDIRVRGWNRAEVDVRGDLGAGVERLDVISKPHGVEIKVVLPKFSIRNGSADLVIQVPERSRVEISAVSADVSLADLHGDARIKVVSGDVRAVAGGQVLEAESVSGDVALDGADAEGKARVRSVSGDVRVTHYSGEVEAVSVSGDVVVGLDTVRSARLSTTSGDVKLSGSLLPSARIEAESVSGDVVLDLAGKGQSSVEIETHSGDIGGCYSDRVQRKREHGPGRILVLEGASDGATIRVKTLSGDASFCDR